MPESGEDDARARERREAKRRQRALDRRERRKEWERFEEQRRSRRFWQLLAAASLALFAFLSLLLIVPSLFDHGPLARGHTRDLDEARTQEVRAAASTSRAELATESIEAATALASLLGPLASAAGQEGSGLTRQGADLIGSFLTDVGFPLSRDGARTVGRAIWNRYVGRDAAPAFRPAPVVGGSAGTTINLTIVIRDGRRPQVVTRVVRVPPFGG